MAAVRLIMIILTLAIMIAMTMMITMIAMPMAVTMTRLRNYCQLVANINGVIWMVQKMDMFCLHPYCKVGIF